jgi:hypothetical protein
MGPTQKDTGRLTVDRNLTSTSSQSLGKPNAWGYNWATLFLREIITRT